MLGGGGRRDGGERRVEMEKAERRWELERESEGKRMRGHVESWGERRV